MSQQDRINNFKYFNELKQAVQRNRCLVIAPDLYGIVRLYTVNSRKKWRCNNFPTVKRTNFYYD